MTSQALILAGGLGTRLGEITKNIPKPMVPVGDKPFLHWLVELLKRSGINRFVLCTGYLSEKIEEYFGDGTKFGCSIQYSAEQTPLGTGGAIKKAAGLLEETFLVLSGDNYLPLNFRDYVNSFSRQSEKTSVGGMLACWDNEPPMFRSNVLLDENSRKILSYDFKSDEGKNFVDIGVKIFNHRLFDYFPAQEKFSLEIDCMGRMAADGLLTGYPVEFPPLDVGTHEGLTLVRAKLGQGVPF